MGLLDKISDDFQHSRGQKDGANGKPRGDFNQKYDQGYDAGKFDHDKKKYGETFARVAKDERDFAKRISEGGKKSKATGEEATIKEESHREAEYCPFCGGEYDGVYCYNCEEDEYYDDNEGEQYEPPKPTRQQIIAEKLAGKNESGLMEIYDNARKNKEEDLKSAALEKLAGIRGRFYAYHYTSPQAIKRALDSGLYSGVTFVDPDYLCTYKCTCCGHEWDTIKKYGFDNPAECRMGCSSGAGEPSFLGLCKIIKGLITGREPFGYGKLIRSEKL